MYILVLQYQKKMYQQQHVVSYLHSLDQAMVLLYQHYHHYLILHILNLHLMIKDYYWKKNGSKNAQNMISILNGL